MAELTAADEPEDFGKGDVGRYARWMREIEAYGKVFDKWSRRVPKIVDRFRAEHGQMDVEAQYSNIRERRFNILWANIRTLQPAIYSKTPKPEVFRRFSDSDPVAKGASILLERCLSATLDKYDFDVTLKHARDDYLLGGRGQAWVRYIPTFGEERRERASVLPGDDGTMAMEDGTPVENPQDVRIGDDGEPYMEVGEPFKPVVYEEVVCDYVNWADFGHTVAPTWAKVRAVWKRELLTREQLIARFGAEKGREVGLTYNVKGADTPEQSNSAEDEARNEVFKRAEVYEIWDKESRKAMWLSPGFKDHLLDERDDPLGLDGFFPCPRPLYDTMTTDTLVPIPEYTEYQSQAEELDELTRRIYTLLGAVRAVGFYDAEIATDGNVQGMLEHGNYDNMMVPVQNWAMFAEKGGAKGTFSFFPLDVIVQTIQVLAQMREGIKRDLYEITGLADIVRGQTQASETLGAQQLKARFAALRLDERKAEMERFARDLLRLKAEVMAEHFSPETLREMSGFDYWPDIEPVPVEQRPELFGQIVALLRDEGARGFRIDVETDSTVLPDQEREQQSTVMFLQAVTPFLEKMLMGVQEFPAAALLLKQMLLMGVRSFKKGRHLEASFEQAMDALVEEATQKRPGDEGNAAEMAKLQLAAKAQEDKVEMEKARLMTDQATTQARLARDDQRNQGDSARGMQALQIQQADLASRIAGMQQQAAQANERLRLDMAKFEEQQRKNSMEAQRAMLDGFRDMLEAAAQRREARPE